MRCGIRKKNYIAVKVIRYDRSDVSDRSMCTLARGRHTAVLFCFLLIVYRVYRKLAHITVFRHGCAFECHGEYLVRVAHRDKFKRFAHDRVDLFKIADIVGRDNNTLHTGIVCGESLFFKTADRKYLAAQCYLTCHGYVAADLMTSEC